MKAIHGFGPGDVRVVEVPDPAPGAGEVLIAVRASGICGSDKWLWRAEAPVTRIAGHEVMGEVVELGAGVAWLGVGDRVAVNNVVGCGVCPACRTGSFVRCPHWAGAHDVNGGFGELVVAPQRNCMKLDDAVDDVTGSLLFDNFGTPYAALERGSVGAGDDVVVSGLGPIGLAAVILARLRGAFVIAVDPLPYRRRFAATLGAHATLSPGEDLPEAVLALTSDLGARVVIECSGHPDAYPPGIASLRIGGVMVTVGEHGQLDLHPSRHLIRRHLSLVGTWYATMQQGQAVQDLVVQHKLQPDVLVTDRGSLDDFPALFEKVCESPGEVAKAVIVMDGRR
jgi:threonine dehydrogenase-like Zn-dependent dehydrogenase